jgi:hypothetical protein
MACAVLASNLIMSVLSINPLWHHASRRPYKICTSIWDGMTLLANKLPGHWSRLQTKSVIYIARLKAVLPIFVCLVVNESHKEWL